MSKNTEVSGYKTNVKHIVVGWHGVVVAKFKNKLFGENINQIRS